MKLLQILRDRYSFTRGEAAVILFLSITYASGLGIRWLGEGSADTSVTLAYQTADSTFRARSLSDSANTGRSVPPAGANTRRDSLEAGSINVNTATAEELDRLPGIGPHYAREIVRHREQHGRFRTIEGLLEVKGIGPKKLARIRPHVRLE